MTTRSVKLTVEAEIAIVRTKGGKIESTRGAGIAGHPTFGDQE